MNRKHPNLQANFQVEFTSTSNDMFTGLIDPGLDTRVGLGETLETFDELGEIRGVLNLNSDLDDGRDGEFHDLHVVCRLGSGEGTALEQELINADETNDVTGGTVLKRLDTATHHEDGTLDGLDEQVILLSGNVVGALDTDLGASTDSTGEDTSKGVETSLIGGGHHLGDIEDQRAFRVAVADTNGGFIIHGTLVESLNTVTLSGSGRREVDDNHLEEGVTGGQELPHHDLQQSFAVEILLLGGKFDVKLLEHTEDGILLEVHDGFENPEDRVQDEGVEGAVEGFTGASSVSLGGPLLRGRIEEVVTPKFSHHFLLIDAELLGVTGGELAEGEGPSMETGAKGDGTLLGVYLDISESDIVISGDDDVDVLDGTGELLEQLLRLDLKFKQGAVDLIDDNDGFDTLGKSLSEHSFRLDADALNTVDDDQGTVGNAESGGNFGREIDVSR